MPKLSRRQFIETSAAAAVATALPAVLHAAAPTKPRNVVFISVDDLNTSIGCYGNTEVHTPNIDRLAARGVRFARTYCQYAWCSPSRTSLLTGYAPDTTGVYDLNTHFRKTIPNVTTLPQLFRKNGYYVARVGKIYHQSNPEGIGEAGRMDDPASWDYVYDPAGADHTKEESELTIFGPRHNLGSTIAYHESEAADDQITDHIGADHFIDLLKAKKDKPFFLAFGMYRPHVPWVVPKAYFDMYPVEKIKARTYAPAELTQAPAVAYATRPVNGGMDEMQSRMAIRAYYAAASFMDAQVGRVLDAIKELGLEDNTTVVFWADHGWALGEHGQWQKEALWDTVGHVPTIMAGAGVTAHGKSCMRTTEHLDMYPTLAEMFQLKGVPADLHGRSLLPLLGNPDAQRDKPAVSQLLRTKEKNGAVAGYSIRNERYRYTSWGDGTIGEELYDYESDPHEVKNLAADPASAKLKADLKAQLAAITASRKPGGKQKA